MTTENVTEVKTERHSLPDCTRYKNKYGTPMYYCHAHPGLTCPDNQTICLHRDYIPLYHRRQIRDIRRRQSATDHNK